MGIKLPLPPATFFFRRQLLGRHLVGNPQKATTAGTLSVLVLAQHSCTLALFGTRERQPSGPPLDLIPFIFQSNSLLFAPIGSNSNSPPWHVVCYLLFVISVGDLVGPELGLVDVGSGLEGRPDSTYYAVLSVLSLSRWRREREGGGLAYRSTIVGSSKNRLKYKNINIRKL